MSILISKNEAAEVLNTFSQILHVNITQNHTEDIKRKVFWLNKVIISNALAKRRNQNDKLTDAITHLLI